MLPHSFVLHTAAPPEKVFLSGTAIFPIEILSSSVQTVQLGWLFKDNGTLVGTRDGAEQENMRYVWNSNAPSPKGNYWIKITYNAGISGSGTTNGFDPFNGILSANWTATGGVVTGGSVKVEIAKDATGQEILATGYYGMYSEGGR